MSTTTRLMLFTLLSTLATGLLGENVILQDPLVAVSMFQTLSHLDFRISIHLNAAIVAAEFLNSLVRISRRPDPSEEEKKEAALYLRTAVNCTQYRRTLEKDR